MKRDPAPPTTRQDWDKFSTEAQRDIDQQLSDLQLEIDRANSDLAHLYKADPEASGEYARDIVDYLNDKWRYFDDIFMVTGHWHQPQVTSGLDGILSQHIYSEAFSSARSNGFVAKLVETELSGESPRVGMSFVVSTIELATPNIQSSDIKILAFAEPHEVSLQYLRPDTPEVVSTDANEVGQAIVRADRLLHLYTSHPGSSFFQQSAKKQSDFFDSLSDIVDSSLPRPDSQDVAILHDAATQAVYFKKDDQVIEGVIPNSGRVNITGKILGATIPDSWATAQTAHYTSPSELHATGAGLCLIIDQHNLAIPEVSGPLLVPYRAIDAPLRLSVQ